MGRVIPLTCLEQFQHFRQPLRKSVDGRLVLVLDSEEKVAQGIKPAIDT